MNQQQYDELRVVSDGEYPVLIVETPDRPGLFVLPYATSLNRCGCSVLKHGVRITTFDCGEGWRLWRHDACGWFRWVSAAVVFVVALLLIGGGARPAAASESREAWRCLQATVAFEHEWKYELRHATVVPVVCRDGSGTPYAGMFVGSAVALMYRPALVETDANYRAVLFHEYGHGWYAHRLTDAQRARFGALRHLPGGLALDEDYADVFAGLVGHTAVRGNPYRTVMPDAATVAAICAERLVPCVA